MSNRLHSFKFLILMVHVLVIPLILFAQASQQKPAKAQQKTQLTYSQRIKQSDLELNRSQIYFLSFKKSHEISYLTLATTRCTNAIKALTATQAMFPNTTRLYYQAKNKRFAACQFFSKMQDTASRLDPRYHIKDIADNGCDF